MKLSVVHPTLSVHHRYQLEIILLFVFGFFLFFPYFLALELLDLDVQTWQWVLFVPWLTFYIWYSLKVRATIPDKEKQPPLKRAIGHWVLLGLSLVALHLEPRSLEDLAALDIAFLIFSLFLADSFWDFKKISLFAKSNA